MKDTTNTPRSLKECEGCAIPDANEFREWVRESLFLLSIRPSNASRDIGVSENLVSKFLSSPDREMTMGNAACLERYLFAQAKERDCKLLPVGHSMRAQVA